MEESANLVGFLHWAASLGISDSPISQSPSHSCLGHSLSVSQFPDAGGRGIAAARVLKKGELVLRVPKAALMTSDCLIRTDHALSSALEKYPSLSSTQIFSVALLNEVNKGTRSWWHPYLKQLPRSYDLLASFGQFEIDALQIDDAIWAAEKALLKCKTEWEEASPLMCEVNLKPQLKTLNAWLWASATISSRSMHIPWDTAGCLCPVADFFNYTPPEEDSYHLNSTEKSIEETSDVNTDRLIDAGYDEAVACYCFYAKRYYGQGEQVLLSYGVYTNLELLEHYGFILEKNPNNKAFIPLETEMHSLCSWPQDSVYISQEGKPSFALLSTARLWATSPNKRRSVKRFVCSGQRISNENEVAVMEWVVKTCQALLSSFSTSMNEDALLLSTIEKIQNYSFDEIRAFLESNGLMSRNLSLELGLLSTKKRRSICRWKLAVQWRYGYKKILCDCISYCTKVLANLS